MTKTKTIKQDEYDMLRANYVLLTAAIARDDERTGGDLREYLKQAHPKEYRKADID